MNADLDAGAVAPRNAVASLETCTTSPGAITKVPAVMPKDTYTPIPNRAGSRS
ncbi:hypothetical protein LRHMDP3_1297 [Lacticaseibacillus rhamnosus LRHMDP3]|uniref:Uncharacterized protein n=1 Tax=Lacticaseibacillus rhamnosus LRHMDP3 TaxID=1203259 RepID=A0AB33XVY6_LACRH|nr:hypothetical protein LRHMDP3_1297 [Lacticaseibacillus rhamnosus LRHMDP3]